MTKEQARQVGRMIATARKRKGWSLRRLSVETDISHPWLFKLEQGGNTTPTPEWLIRVTDVLGIDPDRINRIVNAHMAEHLPSVRTYFRAKYDLTPEEIAEIERTIQDLQHKHERR